MVSRFPPRLLTGAHPLHTPLHRGCLFLVGYCVSCCRSLAVQRQRCISFLYFLPLNLPPPNDYTAFGTPSLSLIFDGSCFSAPSKRTSRGDHKPATGRLLWTHGESWRQDLGAPLPYPWRERAKLLEGRVAAAHLDVVGCGLWVVGCGLWVVGCVVGLRVLCLTIPIL